MCLHGDWPHATWKQKTGTETLTQAPWTDNFQKYSYKKKYDSQIFRNLLQLLKISITFELTYKLRLNTKDTKQDFVILMPLSRKLNRRPDP